uniref:Uncharacterized protein n=2 Tax=Eptatretus burgeri TaxID=7764 RepID=A0A8C4N6M9_EPTBU
MGLSYRQALHLLGLGEGATTDEIRSAYKRLALQYHPDKHENSPAATKKFQDVSEAYKVLTANSGHPEEFEEMQLALIRLLKGDYFWFMHFANSDDDYDEFSDDGSEEELDNCFKTGAGFRGNRAVRNLYTQPAPSKDASADKLSYTAEEVKRSADELIRQEEIAKKKAERRKEKKKRKKERKNERQKCEAKVEEDAEVLEHVTSTTQAKGDHKQPETMVNGASQDVNTKKAQSSADACDKDCRIDFANKNVGCSANGEKQPAQTNYAPTNGLASTLSNGSDDSQKVPTLACGKSLTSKGNIKSPTLKSDNDEEPAWDVNSAFFTKASSKVKVKTKPVRPENKEKKEKPKVEVKEPQKPDEPPVDKSLEYAVKGHKLACAQLYSDAVEMFTNAILLNSEDCRYFCNRAFCYEHLNEYNKALSDALRAIHINPSWTKAYFRKGKALVALKRYTEAEKAFMDVLARERGCEEAFSELQSVRCLCLMELGFSKVKSLSALREYETIEATLEALLSEGGPSSYANVTRSRKFQNAAYHREQAAQCSVNGFSSQQSIATSLNQITSLWVGNVTNVFTEAMIYDMFSPFGRIHTIRMLLDRRCAFVNFATKEGAMSAFAVLQGYEVAGTKLLIRYQDRPSSSSRSRSQNGRLTPGARAISPWP